MKPKFELLLLASNQDLPFLARQIGVLKAFHTPDRIRVVLSSTHFDRPEVETLRRAGCEVLDEDLVIPGLTLALVKDYVKDIPGAQSRGGWYFKQFVLICYAMTDSPYSHYLAWDADSTPLRPFSFFDDQGRVLYSRKTEHHKPYFKTIARLTGLEKTLDFSFIVEHMMFEKAIGQALVTEILGGVAFSGEGFARRVLDAVDWKDAPGAGFSEYETYGTFAHARFPQRMAFRDLPSIRKGGEFFSRRIGVAGLFGLSRRFAWVTFELDGIQHLWHWVKRRIRRAIGGAWTLEAVVMHPRRYQEFRRTIGAFR